MSVQGVSSNQSLPIRSKESASSSSLCARIQNCLKSLWEAIVSFFQRLCCCSDTKASDASSTKASDAPSFSFDRMKAYIDKIVSRMLKKEYGYLKNYPENEIRSAMSVFREKDGSLDCFSVDQTIEKQIAGTIEEQNQKQPFQKGEKLTLSLVRCYSSPSKEITMDCQKYEITLGEEMLLLMPNSEEEMDKASIQKASIVYRGLFGSLPPAKLTPEQLKLGKGLVGLQK